MVVNKMSKTTIICFSLICFSFIYSNSLSANIMHREVEDSSLRNNGLYKRAIPFVRKGGNGKAYALVVDIEVEGETRQAILDTGSIYYFLASKTNNNVLPSKNPELYSYGVGFARFCPSDGFFLIKNKHNSFVPLIDHPVRMGIANFTKWAEPTYAVFGLSGNITGKNKKNMIPLINQLNPKHMSFLFPDGWSNPGKLKFKHLDGSKYIVPRIPLVDPTTLGYGYTARIVKFDYLINSKIHTTIINKPNGIFLVTGDSEEKIADNFVAFFDTGTPQPLFAANGDISLLGKDIPAGSIFPEETSPFYDSFVLHFEDEFGQKFVISSGNQKDWQKTGDAGLQTRILTKAAIDKAAPNGMKLYAPVIGLPFLGQFNIEFEFDNGMAKYIRFAPSY